MLSDNYAGNCCIVQKYGFITFINDKRVRNVGIKASKNFVGLVNAQLLLVGKRVPMLSADLMGHPLPFFGLLATALRLGRGPPSGSWGRRNCVHIFHEVVPRIKIAAYTYNYLRCYQPFALNTHNGFH